MPKHFKGLTGLAKGKALAEHRAITGEEVSPDLDMESSIRPDLELESPIRPDLDMEYSPGGMYNAMDRSIQEYAGGGKVGYAKIGMYKKGGKVK